MKKSYTIKDVFQLAMSNEKFLTKLLNSQDLEDTCKKARKPLPPEELEKLKVALKQGKSGKGGLQYAHNLYQYAIGKKSPPPPPMPGQAALPVAGGGQTSPPPTDVAGQPWPPPPPWDK